VFLTHRGGIVRLEKFRKPLAASFNQEQEAYLLPGLNVTASAGVYSQLSISGYLDTRSFSWFFLPITPVKGVLFSGRHLLPTG